MRVRVPPVPPLTEKHMTLEDINRLRTCINPSYMDAPPGFDPSTLCALLDLAEEAIKVRERKACPGCRRVEVALWSRASTWTPPCLIHKD
jgi:hypothetical protein